MGFCAEDLDFWEVFGGVSIYFCSFVFFSLKISVTLLIMPTIYRTTEDWNVLGLGIVKGCWRTNNLMEFVEKFVTLKPTQKPYVISMEKFKNFCTVFDFDFRFKKKTPVPHSDLMNLGFKLNEFTKESNWKERSCSYNSKTDGLLSKS